MMFMPYSCSVRKPRSDKLPPEEKKRRRLEASRRYHASHKDQIAAQRRNRRGGEALREYGLRSLHGMTIAQWHEFWERQGGLCCLCELPMTRPRPGRGTARLSDASIDHDHRCCPSGRSCPSCWRGLAHRSCNALVGQAGDDPDRLMLIARNLQRARGVMPDAK